MPGPKAGTQIKYYKPGLQTGIRLQGCLYVSRHKLIATLASALVLIVVLVSLFMTGSPTDARSQRLDAIRVQHLQALNAAIDLHIRRNNFMPPSLLDAVNGQRLSILPVDPESGEEYSYAQINSSAYELCAVFSAASVDDAATNFWAHAAGRACFAFTVSANTVLQ